MLNDETLILEFQRGSRDAFEELFARYREPVHGFFRRRLSDRQRAEDLTQETFLAVIRASARYEPRSPVRAYLFGIAFKLVAAERRSLARQGPPPPSAGPPASPPAPDAAPPAPDAALWVRQAIARLDPSEREILMLREYEQLSYAEIAGILRMPLNTVRTRLFRARLALKEQLHATR
jgi:RNA polymerase sigma-70 factor, ECF subfamily